MQKYSSHREPSGLEVSQVDPLINIFASTVAPSNAYVYLMLVLYLRKRAEEVCEKEHRCHLKLRQGGLIKTRESTAHKT